MRRNQPAEDLSVEELRRLLVEKRRNLRTERLEHYRRTGRVVTLASDLYRPAWGAARPVADGAEETLASPPRSATRRLLDTLLLIIETLAVLGLVFVLFNGLDILRQLNVESAQSQALPTLTPTPVISAVVLPSGHTPPNSPGGARPNDDEIPEALRPYVQSLASLPLPTPGPEQAIHIEIPAIGLDLVPVVQGDGWEQLKKGVGQHAGSANPGQPGNVVLSAHNDIYGERFRYLDQLRPGDRVILYTSQRAYTYIVVGEPLIVEKNRGDLMGPTREAMVTLISCYPYMVDNKRIVVQAQLLDTNP